MSKKPDTVNVFKDQEENKHLAKGKKESFISLKQSSLLGTAKLWESFFWTMKHVSFPRSSFPGFATPISSEQINKDPSVYCFVWQIVVFTEWDIWRGTVGFGH